MHTSSAWLQRVRRPELLIVATLLLAASAAAWSYLLVGSDSMSDPDSLIMPMHSGPWSIGYALLMLVMWVVMMIAMMLPSATPAILLFATIARSAQKKRAPQSKPLHETGNVLSILFALGYLLVWAGFSVVAVALQWALDQAALLSPMLQTTNRTLAGVALIVIGIYQCTPFKQACMRHCRSPPEFMLTQWRNGAAGALTMGMQHGAICVGCCWALMLLLFVGGVMNLLWVGALSVLVIAEKYAAYPHWIRRGSALVLVVWGIATLVAFGVR